MAASQAGLFGIGDEFAVGTFFGVYMIFIYIQAPIGPRHQSAPSVRFTLVTEEFTSTTSAIYETLETQGLRTRAKRTTGK